MREKEKRREKEERKKERKKEEGVIPWPDQPFYPISLSEAHRRRRINSGEEEEEVLRQFKSNFCF